MAKLLSGTRVYGNLTIDTFITATGNVTGGNLITAGLLSVTGNANVGNIGATNANVTAITATGNANVGNLGTAGLITATGNITGGNLNTGAQVVATGNITGGNLSTAGQVTVTGNITGGNLLINNNAVITGNLTVQGTETIFNVNTLTVNDKDIVVANNVTGGANVNGAGILAGNPTVASWLFNNATTSWQSNIGITPSANGTLDLGGASNRWGNVWVTTLTATGNANVGNLGTAGIISASGNITGGNILGNGAGLSGINVFSNVSIDGGNSILADSIADTLTLIAGDGISLIGNAAADSITIALTGSGESIFVTGGDMGTVTESVTETQDLGLITDIATTEIDMGTIVTGGVVYPDQLVLPSYTVAELGNLTATPAAQMVYCTDDTGGAVPAFSDGTNWRRVTDRQIVS